VAILHMKSACVEVRQDKPVFPVGFCPENKSAKQLDRAHLGVVVVKAANWKTAGLKSPPLSCSSPGCSRWSV